MSNDEWGIMYNGLMGIQRYPEVKHILMELHEYNPHEYPNPYEDEDADD